MGKFALKLIMARFAKAAETSISMAFLVMCTGMIRRLICLFLSLSLPVASPRKGQAVSG